MKNNEEYKNLDEKILHTNLISYAQQYISLMSKNVLFNKINFLRANDPIHMVSVTFLEPESNIEQVLEFLPGLSISIPCLMNAKNLDRQQNINIKVFFLKISMFLENRILSLIGNLFRWTILFITN
jgi:hypothetical protein